MKNDLYWIWLTSKPVITPNRITSLLEYFTTAEEIYNAKEYRNIPNIGVREVSALLGKDLKKAEEIKRYTEAMGAKIVTFDDDEYPDMLRHIIPPPYILYVKGDIGGINDILSIGIVGARRYTDYGKLAASVIAGELARNGVIIVSGMARGIDSIAAVQALRNRGRTIAVIGSGLDVAYPPENKDLMEDIASCGAVITEYPPGTPPLKSNFPARNRIIAGLSNGVLVAEAGQRSGALITARLAMEYNRDVFAVPGNITSQTYEGSNRLIQQGAKLTMSANDILEEYPYAALYKAPGKGRAEQRNHKRNKTEESGEEKQEKQAEKNPDPSKYKDLNEADKRIVSLLTIKDMHIDEMSRELNMGIGELSVQLTLLEMQGFIKKQHGGDYKLN